MSSSRVFNNCRIMLAAAKSVTPSSSTAAAGKKLSKKPPSKPDAVTPIKLFGIRKPCPVSPALHQFAGAPEISRADAVKVIWDYIKLHNLQDAVNRKEIHCDEKLKTIFAGKDKVGIMEISKLLSAHFVKTTV